jgi:hypothetical protein
MKRMHSVCMVLGLVAATAACGQASSAPSTPGAVKSMAHRGPRTLHLKPGHYTFHLGDRVRVGDSIRCVTAGGRPAGGGAIDKRGFGTGSSTGFSVGTAKDGTVRVVCPAHPGMM